MFNAKKYAREWLDAHPGFVANVIRSSKLWNNGGIRIMASTNKETLTPTELVKGKFGPQIKVGKDYYSFSKNYKDGALEVGTTYEAEVYVSDKGYKYINSVSGQSKAAKAVKPEAVTDKAVDLKTRQIQRQGTWQAAASNPALIGYAADAEAFKKVVRDIAEDGIRFINE